MVRVSLAAFGPFSCPCRRPCPSMASVQHLVLLDGHHLMYRAYWAIPRTLRTSKGEQTNAVFGVFSMLLAILQQEQPDALLFCFDEGEDTFRHQEAKDYKEGRAETPEDFYAQIPRIIAGIDAFGIRRVSDPRYEADDFLCTYARAAEQRGMRVTIVTGDRDALQLASARTRIAVPQKGYQRVEYLGPDEVFAKYGIRPDQIPSYKGLCGDASDNLSGVGGIGPKTAALLLQKFHTLEGIYAHLSDVRPALRSKLESGREHAFFCQRMALLVCDIPLPVRLEDAVLRDLPASEIDAFFAATECTLLRKRLRTIMDSPYGKRVFRLLAPESAEAPAGSGSPVQMTMF